MLLRRALGSGRLHVDDGWWRVECTIQPVRRSHFGEVGGVRSLKTKNLSLPRLVMGWESSVRIKEGGMDVADCKVDSGILKALTHRQAGNRHQPLLAQ